MMDIAGNDPIQQGTATVRLYQPRCLFLEQKAKSASRADRALVSSRFLLDTGDDPSEGLQQPGVATLIASASWIVRDSKRSRLLLRY